MTIISRIALALAIALVGFADVEAQPKHPETAASAVRHTHIFYVKDDPKAVALMCQKYRTPAGLVTQTTINKTGVVLNHDPLTIERSKELVDRTMSKVYGAGEVQNAKHLTKPEILSLAREVAADLKICIY